jgi:hypothetical protein
MKDAYYLLRQRFLQRATVSHQYGPSINLISFSLVAISAYLLTEAYGDQEKESALCEIAFTAALFRIRPIGIKNNMKKKEKEEEAELGLGNNLVFTSFKF